MGLFGQSSPFDIDIEKATSEKNIVEPWGLIIDICDKVGSSSRNAKDCLRSIMKRMAHNDPHVVIQAITLLDACVNNCGKSFHLEVASRDFENEYKRLLGKAQPQVASKMKMLLKKWAESEFKADPQLNLIPSLYQKLKSEGHDFTDSQKISKPVPSPAPIKDPNVVTSQQEEDDIAKAIELSLKDAKTSPKKPVGNSPYSALYPTINDGATYISNTVNNTSSVSGNSSSANEPRKVRALYDFEAAEENELTFAAGEIIYVLDDSDPNWWKGYNQKGEGLFPSNFVTADLSVEPERIDSNNKNKKVVQFESDNKDEEKTDIDKQNDEIFVPEINEEKIDRLLHLLHEANPEDPSQDSEELIQLEEQVDKMGPLIDTELECVDRKHAQLTQLSSDLVDAINLYHSLMRESDRPGLPNSVGVGMHVGYLGGGYNAQGSMFIPQPIYGMQTVYQQGPILNNVHNVPGMIPLMSENQTPLQSTQNDAPQMPIIGSGGLSRFNQNHSQTIVPLSFQNGHPTNPQQLNPQHMQPSQQLHGTVPPNIQSGQMQQPHQQTHIPPQMMQSNTNTAANMLRNQNFLPPNGAQVFNPQATNFTSLPSNLTQGHVIPQQQNMHPHHLNNNHSHQIQFNNQQLRMISATNPTMLQTNLGQNESITNIPIFKPQR